MGAWEDAFSISPDTALPADYAAGVVALFQAGLPAPSHAAGPGRPPGRAVRAPSAVRRHVQLSSQEPPPRRCSLLSSGSSAVVYRIIDGTFFYLHPWI